MKQNITIKQLEELSKTQKDKLRKWINPNLYSHDLQASSVGLLSIGQMIEFLYQKHTIDIDSEERESPMMGWSVNKKYHALELCDALFEAVKQNL